MSSFGTGLKIDSEAISCIDETNTQATKSRSSHKSEPSSPASQNNNKSRPTRTDF